MASVDDLLALSTSWEGALEQLLLRCRENASVLLQAHTEDEDLVDSVLLELASEVEARLAPIPNSCPHGSQLAILQDLARQHRERLTELQLDGEVVIARGLALGLGSSLQGTLREWYAARGELLIEPGKLHPVHAYDPRPYLDGPANTDPRALPLRSPDVVPNFRLGDRRAANYHIVVTWDARNRLEPLSGRRPLKLAAGQPNMELEEFDIEWLPAPDGGQRVRVRGPKDPTAHLAAVLKIVRLASKERVDVLVLPEYSLDVESRAAVVRELEELPWRPTLVVGGSARIDEGEGSAFNQAVLWMPQGAPRTLTKANRARIGEHAEDIATAGAEFAVFMSGDWAIGLLICADALDPDLVELFRTIGVNLVLIIAMSEKTATMIGNTAHLASASQAFVMLSNGPARWAPPRDERAVAAFEGPYAHGPDPVVIGESDIDPPRKGLHLFDTGERTHRFLAIDTPRN